MFKIHRFLYDGEDGGGGGGGKPKEGSGGAADDQPETYDAWLGKQDDKTKALLQEHTKGLKSALDSERGNRKDLEKQVRELAAKAEKGSESETQLTKLADELAESDRKADFYDAAHKAGITNLKLAYLTAKTEGLFDKKGNVDFAAMKKDFPELFGAKKPPSGGAGDGTENELLPADMNTRIRRAAGRVR